MNAIAKNIIRLAILFVLLILAMTILAIGNTLQAQSSDNGKFPDYGDTRVNDSNHLHVMESITENTSDYRFVINTGDVGESVNSKSE